MNSSGNNSAISQEKSATVNTSGSIYIQPDSDCELDAVKHWFFELGKNEDFTVCDDDDIIARIDPPIFVSSNQVTAETDCDRPHAKKDDSNSSVNGACQVDAEQLCQLKSLEWMSDILTLKNDNPSHTVTMVKNLSRKGYNLKNLFKLKYLTLWLIEQYVPSDTKEYEQCRIIVSNSTQQQLKHHLACFGSDLYTIANNMMPVYESYTKNARCLWPLIGKFKFL